MSFTSLFDSLCIDQLRLTLNSFQAGDVQQVLDKSQLNVMDFACLLSPAAADFVKPMAERAALLTRQRFGNTMQMFVPLYLSNLCANECSYCGFSLSNKLKRKTLNLGEVEQECRSLKAMGFDSVLIVTGEHERKVGMAYFASVMPLLRRYFSYVMFEVQPLTEQEYAQLKTMGVDAVLVYQETYHPHVYASHHTFGKKKDFNWRLATPERVAQAGIDKIGLGVLLGLADWRSDSLMVAYHLQYLRKHFWRSRYSISFPRLRPCTGGLSQQSVLSDKQLVQLICAFRLFDPELEISLSTRESPWLRDNLMSLGVTSMSAGSSTQPGGYANAQSELEQFSIDDNRSPTRVAEAITSKGLQPVWTDWHSAYSMTSE